VKSGKIGEDNIKETNEHFADDLIKKQEEREVSDNNAE